MQDEVCTMTYDIPERNIKKLQVYVENLNKQMKDKGHGSIDLKILDEVTKVNNDGETSHYFRVQATGMYSVGSIKYLGRSMPISENNKRIYSVIDPEFSDEDLERMKAHGEGCDCCKAKRSRNEVYYFECTDDFRVGNDMYKKDSIISLGSSCVDKFVCLGAMDILQKFAGLGTKESREGIVERVYVEPVHFSCYMNSVARKHIDDIYTYIVRNNPKLFSADSSKNSGELRKEMQHINEMTLNKIHKLADEYSEKEKSVPATYRRLSIPKSGKGYGCEGTISKTSKALYFMQEDNHYDVSYFKNPNCTALMKRLCNNYGITKENMDKESLEHSKVIRKIIGSVMIANPTCAVDKIVNKNMETMSEVLDEHVRIHKDYTQFIVDIFDAVYLKNKHDTTYHEEPKNMSINRNNYRTFSNFGSHLAIDKSSYRYKFDNNGNRIDYTNNKTESESICLRVKSVERLDNGKGRPITAFVSLDSTDRGPAKIDISCCDAKEITDSKGIKYWEINVSPNYMFTVKRELTNGEHAIQQWSGANINKARSKSKKPIMIIQNHKIRLNKGLMQLVLT